MQFEPYDIPILVIAGGPNAGKTDVYLDLQQQFAGAPIEFLPEAATLFHEGPLRFTPLPKDPEEWATERGRNWSTYYQVGVFMSQVVQVKQALLKAQLLRQRRQAGEDVGDIKLIVSDRLWGDLSGYLTPEGLAFCNMMLGVTEEEMMRYIDTVIFLDSTAHHSPDLFERLKKSNPARREELPEAVEVNAKLRKSWVRHPRCLTFDGPYTMDDAKRLARSEVQRLLGLSS